MKFYGVCSVHKPGRYGGSDSRLPRFLFLLVFCSASAPSFADVLAVQSSPEFVVEGASLWKPDGTGADLSTFKTDVVNIANTGVLDSVVGVDLSATTATRQGDPVLICAAGTFPSVVIEGFILGDPFQAPPIEVGTGCYSCPEGYSHNALFPANVEGVCFQIGRIARARLEADPEFLCPAGQFISGDFSGCYSCPVGFDHNPLLTVDTPGVCTDNRTANRGKAIGCEGSEFPNTLLQSCYTCPTNYDHNPLLPVDTPGVCSDKTTANDAGGLSCPSGYSWKLDILSCAKCSKGYSYSGLGICSKGSLLTFDLKTENASTRSVGCFDGKFLSGTRCFTCPNGYSHNPLLIAEIPGVCFINKTADYAHAYGCEGSSFDGLDGNCYACDGGYTHNPLLAVITPGVCYNPDTANRQGDITFICPAGEFYDPVSNRCASCATGYKHNPLLPASVPGVCFESEDIVADYQNDVALEGCGTGEFFDVVTGGCYSCPTGSEWNPTAGVDEVGACVGLELVDRGTGDFDLGMELDYDYKYKMGVSGGILIDEGSVDVRYAATIDVAINTTATPGHYTITTRQDDVATDLSMSSTFPAVDMFYDNYIDNFSKVGVRVLYPKLTPTGWEQASDDMPVWDTSSGGEHNLAFYMLDTSTPEKALAAEATPIVNFHVGVDGLALDLLGFEMANLIADGLLPGNLFGLPSVPGGGLFDPPLELTQNLFNKDLIGDVLLEIGIGTPDMNTPARIDPPYQGDYTQQLDIPRSTLIGHNLVAGSRTGIEFGALNSGLKDPDVFRADIDVDGLVAVSTGYAVGKRIAVPSPVPLVSYWSLSLSALDLDVGAVFHFAKDLKFEPNLDVVLNFNKPTKIETSPGSGVFELRTSKRVSLGDDYEIIHPGGQLYVDTSYSLDRNLFTNDTNLMLSPLLEGEVLSAQLKVLGVPKTWLPKITAIRLSTDLWPEPIKIADISQFGQPDRAEFPLNFADVGGSQLAVIYGPVASCQDGSLSLDGLGQVIANAQDYYTGPQGEIPYTYSLDRDTFSCADLGSQPLVLTVTDENGVSDSCAVNLTIVDDLPICPYTIGGTVTGLNGSGLVLQNNLGGNLNITGNGNFVFTGTQVKGTDYAVTVLTNPGNLSQNCVVSNGSGTLAAANITNVSVECTTNSFVVSGNLSGLDWGNTLVLQNNGADDLAVTSNGGFSFATPLLDGSDYDVTLLSIDIGYTPIATTNAVKGNSKTDAIKAGQNCVITNGSGILAGSNVINVNITCTLLPLVPIPTRSIPGLLFLIFAMLVIFGWQRKNFGIR